LKGGVGKTSSVVSLGSALASFGKKVLLVDANFSAPNLGIHLNVVDPKKTMHSEFSDKFDLSDAVIEREDFHLIPASLFPKARIDPLKLKEKLKQLKKKYDVILLDSSPALNEETLSVILAADELVVITTPDYSTLSTTLKAVRVAKKGGTPIVGLVLNKVHNKNFELSLGEIERTSSVPVLAVVPHDLDVLKAQSEFKPYFEFSPKSLGAEEYGKLAGLLVGEKYVSPVRRFNFRRFVAPKQQINRDIFYNSLFE